MIRIINVLIPDKNISIALTSIFGIGNSSSLKILKRLEINPFLKSFNLNDSQITQISNELKNYCVENDLRKLIKKNANSHFSISCRRAIRWSKNLPVNGQSTRHNSRTLRGKRKTVAGKAIKK